MVPADPNYGGRAESGVGVVPQDREQLHTAVLVAPSQERRRLRRQRRRAEARLHAEQRKATLAAAKAEAEQERAERRARVYLPRAGELGAARLRTPGRFRLPRHQDTSATLAGAYPFVTEGGLGADGVFVGQDLYSGGVRVRPVSVVRTRGHHRAQCGVGWDRRVREVGPGEVLWGAGVSETSQDTGAVSGPVLIAVARLPGRGRLAARSHSDDAQRPLHEGGVLLEEGRGYSR